MTKGDRKRKREHKGRNVLEGVGKGHEFSFE